MKGGVLRKYWWLWAAVLVGLSNLLGFEYFLIALVTYILVLLVIRP